MPEEPEVEMRDIQESLEEGVGPHGHPQHPWTRWVPLTTAFLAAFAAVGALQSGALVNEAMVAQLRASDGWAEYQSDRQKSHLYALHAADLLDRGATPAAASPEDAKEKGPPRRLSPADRLARDLAEVARQDGKAKELSERAKRLEEEAESGMHRHHRFAYSVALLQVAIALGALSALARSRPLWALSGLAGAVGIALFVLGFLGR